MNATALIAEDEPHLAAALKAELAAVWPALAVLATVGDGHSAVAQALALQPDVLFFDVRMPGQTGLQAAAELAQAWPAHGPKPFPALVFVTAHDEYAVAAFEAQAVDYLLKPVQRQRVQKMAQKVQFVLIGKAHAAINFDGFSAPPVAQLAQLAALLAQAQALPAQAAAPPRLRVLQASVSGAHGAALVMVPLAQVLYFEAADKYVRVITPGRELLLRTPLKDLLGQLDDSCFWQIHRGTVVRADAIASAHRDEAGKLWVHLHAPPGAQPGSPPIRLPVSRAFVHRFKAM